MSNYVKVCSFSPTRLTATDETADRPVERMKDYWWDYLKKAVHARPDLIVLPECCDSPKFVRTGKTGTEERYDAYLLARGEKIQQFLCEIASQYNCYIAYSAKWKQADGRRRNSTRMIDRQGNVMGEFTKWYNTLQEMGHQAVIGTELPVFECDFGRVVAVICYDMMFDDIHARTAALKPDIIVFSSAVSYGIMAGLWAFTCESYLVSSVIETGADVYSPLGDRISASTGHNDHTMIDINLDRAVVQRYPLIPIERIRQKYGDRIRMAYPAASEVNSILLTSESEDVTAGHIVAEFGISTLQDRLSRTVQMRNQMLSSPSAD